MHPHPSAPVRAALTPLVCAALLLAGGCASDDARPARHARAPEHFATLEGHATFFAGRITAEVLVGAMTGFDREGSGTGGGGGGGGGHGRHGGGGGGGMRMRGTGGMHDGAPVGLGGSPRGGDSDEGDAPGRRQAMAMQRASAMDAPPVMIHLRFVNHGTEKADIDVADFLSPLGNFVVQPEKLSIEPGESAEVEPMTSRLAGEVTDGEIALTLRLGGASEVKTIALAVQPEPPAAPASAAAPAPETPPAK